MSCETVLVKDPGFQTSSVAVQIGSDAIIIPFPHYSSCCKHLLRGSTIKFTVQTWICSESRRWSRWKSWQCGLHVVHHGWWHNSRCREIEFSLQVDRRFSQTGEGTIGRTINKEFRNLLCQCNNTWSRQQSQTAPRHSPGAMASALNGMNAGTRHWWPFKYRASPADSSWTNWGAQSLEHNQIRERDQTLKCTKWRLSHHCKRSFRTYCIFPLSFSINYILKIPFPRTWSLVLGSALNFAIALFRHHDFRSESFREHRPAFASPARSVFHIYVRLSSLPLPLPFTTCIPAIARKGRPAGIAPVGPLVRWNILPRGDTLGIYRYSGRFPAGRRYPIHRTTIREYVPFLTYCCYSIKSVHLKRHWRIIRDTDK